MMEYQRAVRDRQIERAKKLLALKDPEEIKKGPNDVRRFMKRVSKTKTGENAVVEYVLDESKIAEEEKYDGYYAVATNLADPAKDILAVSQKRYQIEECFLVTTLKNMNVANIHDIDYMALYKGSKSLNALTQLTMLPLDRRHYRPKDLNRMIKKYLS